MKIVHVITGLGQGGAEAVLYRLIAACDDPENHYVVSLRDDGVYAAPLRLLGVSVTCLNLMGVADMVHAISSLRSIMLELSPDVVQTWMYHADLIGGVAARLNGIPVVWGLHNSNFEKKYTKPTTRLVVRLCSLVSNFIPKGIVSCSKTARDLHVAVGYPSAKFTIIPNGLNLSEFKFDRDFGKAFRESVGLGPDCKIFLNVARYHPQKDHRNLIRSFSIAFADDPRAHLVLCGAGMDEGNRDVAAWLADTPLRGRVHLLGARSDIPKVLSGADYFVLSSVGEAFPCVVAEAMACEVPCVVTDVGDCRDIVESTGWVVPPLNAAALAQALKLADSENESERLQRGVRARMVAMDNFDIKSMLQAYQAVWSAAVK